MKLYRKLLAAALSAALTGSLAAGLPARAALDAPDLSYAAELDKTATLSSKEAAALLIRENFRERNTSFTVTVGSSLISSKNDISDMISMALAETGDPHEGDYLRWTIKRYSYTTTANSRNGTTSVAFTLTYNSTVQQEAQVDKAVDELIKKLDLNGKSNYEKISKIYSYIAGSVTYPDSIEDLPREYFSAYGALVNNAAVCQGYALLLYRLLSEADVPCRLIPGTANGGNHAWNIAEAGGKYYYLDVTWDSTLGNSKPCYLMRGTSDFDSLLPQYSHSAGAWDPNSPLYSDYSANFFARYPMSETAYDPASRLSFRLGDPDSDGRIDSTDASVILAAYARLSTGQTSGLTEPSKAAADANSDGAIDSNDASLILSYYALTSTGSSLSLADYIKTL